MRMIALLCACSILGNAYCDDYLLYQETKQQQYVFNPWVYSITPPVKIEMIEGVLDAAIQTHAELYLQDMTTNIPILLDASELIVAVTVAKDTVLEIDLHVMTKAAYYSIYMGTTDVDSALANPSTRWRKDAHGNNYFHMELSKLRIDDGDRGRSIYRLYVSNDLLSNHRDIVNMRKFFHEGAKKIGMLYRDGSAIPIYLMVIFR